MKRIINKTLRSTIPYESSFLSYAIISFLSLTLSACNPLAKTKLGSEYHPNTLISTSTSLLSVSSSQVATGNL